MPLPRSSSVARSPKRALRAPVLALALVALAAPVAANASPGSSGAHAKKPDTAGTYRGGKPAGAGTGHRIR